MTRILLIDDEEDVRDSMARLLELEGFETTTARNAKEGLALLDKEEFDLLISDIIMPGIDGVEAISRARSRHSALKILAISGGGNFGRRFYQPDAITTTAYLQAATDAGADCVLTKPFERKDLVGCIRQLVAGG